VPDMSALRAVFVRLCMIRPQVLLLTSGSRATASSPAPVKLRVDDVDPARM
jgi:hypothetical protein